MSVNKRIHRKSYNDLGHAHELTFGCYRGFPFLAKERTCEWLAEAISNARVQTGLRLWSYVFMPNHVHLIVHFGREAYRIEDALKAIKQPVARKALAYLRQNLPEWIPRLTRKRGRKTETHFWQRGGGYDRNITEPVTLEKMIEYIHMNPVRKELVVRPEDWTWSSAGWFLDSSNNVLEPDRIPPEWTIGMAT